MYLLGASIAEAEDGEASVLLRRHAPRNGKLHWRDLGVDGKTKVRELIPRLGLRHVVVIAAPLAASRQERARGRCFERLLWELSRRSVSSVIVEARSPQQDRTDLKRVDGLRARAVIPRTMRVSWVPGVKEAMLWAPDIVIGALGDAHVAGVDVPAGLRETVTEVRIDL